MERIEARTGSSRLAALGRWSLLVVALLARPTSASAPRPAPLQRLVFDPAIFASGDLLFRQGRSLVSRAVLAADGGSEYSHVGIVSVVGGQVWVIHSVPAEEPDELDGAQAEPLASFLAPDKASAAALLRPRDARGARIAEQTAWGFARARLPFDGAFDLHTADRLYCTELVWRSYRSAGIDLAPGADRGRERYLLPSRLLASPALQRAHDFQEEETHP